MKEPKSPCFNCEDRTAENPELGTKDCHSRCERYKKYKEDHREWSKIVFSQKMDEVQQVALKRQRFKEWNKAKLKGYVK